MSEVNYCHFYVVFEPKHFLLGHNVCNFLEGWNDMHNALPLIAQSCGSFFVKGKAHHQIHPRGRWIFRLEWRWLPCPVASRRMYMYGSFAFVNYKFSRKPVPATLSSPRKGKRQNHTTEKQKTRLPDFFTPKIKSQPGFCFVKVSAVRRTVRVGRHLSHSLAADSRWLTFRIGVGFFKSDSALRNAH